MHVGQAAGLRFSAFNQRTTPEITGTLTRILADVSQDQRSGQSYYVVRIGISPEQVARLGNNAKLVPGMPVEVFIRPMTAPLSPISPSRCTTRSCVPSASVEPAERAVSEVEPRRRLFARLVGSEESRHCRIRAVGGPSRRELLKCWVPFFSSSSS